MYTIERNFQINISQLIISYSILDISDIIQKFTNMSSVRKY